MIRLFIFFIVVIFPLNAFSSENSDRPNKRLKIEIESSDITIDTQRHREKSLLICDQIKIMKIQEKSHYMPSGNSEIPEKWIHNMVEWSYRITDHYDINREVVALSIRYLNIFLASGVENPDEPRFQLLATTSLYLASKFSGNKLRSSDLEDLSRGQFNKEVIEETEKLIFKAINYRLQPPLAIDYLYLIFEIIHIENLKIKKNIYQLSRDILDRSVLHNSLNHLEQIQIAFSAIGLAVKLKDDEDLLDDMTKKYFKEKLNIDADSGGFSTEENILYDGYTEDASFEGKM